MAYPCKPLVDDDDMLRVLATLLELHDSGDATLANLACVRVGKESACLVTDDDHAPAALQPNNFEGTRPFILAAPPGPTDLGEDHQHC
ncbi:hypothetical protein DYB32_006135 [Aphanomyces invadans]|uniref:Uncharacterized protein n=1 Tax=Aphanomyces invadans TaxID=157072 RepID=A0A3R7CYJ7_9STRA|nr:hypothetical protein DYB32_006135 [Aphanomyces invadans]